MGYSEFLFGQRVGKQSLLIFLLIKPAVPPFVLFFDRLNHFPLPGLSSLIRAVLPPYGSSFGMLDAPSSFFLTLRMTL